MCSVTLKIMGAAALAAFFVATGCSSEEGEPGQYYSAPPDGGDAGGSGGGAGSGGTAGSGGDVGDGSTLDVNPGDAQLPPGDTILYAHNRDTLFSVDPKDPNLALVEVGKFDCIGGTNPAQSMTDLAVDRDGKLYGVSSKYLFLNMEIDAAQNVVHCTAGQVPIDPGALGEDAKFYGLTFAPPTPALGSEETLIGANTIGQLYRINRATGALTAVGTFGKVPSDDGRGHAYPAANVGKNWSLSGDMVFLTNQGTPLGFATVRDCPDPAQAPSNCSQIDTLMEIDVAKLAPTTSGALPIVRKAIRGQILPLGCNDESCGFGAIYGIAAFNDKVYGFAYSGQLLSINNDTGAGTLVSTPLVGDGFAGAGVTTLAPVVPPPPK